MSLQYCGIQNIIDNDSVTKVPIYQFDVVFVGIYYCL